MRTVLAIFLSTAIATMSTAHAAREIEFSTSWERADIVVASIADFNDLSPIRAALGEGAVEAIQRAAARHRFEGKPGDTLSAGLGTASPSEIHLVIRPKAAMRRRDWAYFGGKAAELTTKSRKARVALLADGADAPGLAEAALGARLGAYEYLAYKSEPKPLEGAFVVVGGAAADASALYARQRRHVADAVLWTRDMQSEPANDLYPEKFVQRAREALGGVAGVSIQSLDEREMARLGMGALLGVGRGSARPPRLFIVRYQGAPAGVAPIAFAGKGITFDSGGVSLKPNDGMWMMKADMTGAAVSVAAVMALAKSKAPVNAVALAALAENMPDGNAIRPGDVLKSMSGKTIEILSTDAEGRLVLADALWYAQERYSPSLIVDVATLTGSVGRALGDEYAGLFAREDGVARRLTEAGEAAGEDLWRLPLHPNHFRQIKSDIADVKNGDTGDPGASTGAAFIASFVKEENAWAHLDIAGVDWRTEAEPTLPKGASGFGVRLLYELAVATSK